MCNSIACRRLLQQEHKFAPMNYEPETFNNANSANNDFELTLPITGAIRDDTNSNTCHAKLTYMYSKQSAFEQR